MMIFDIDDGKMRMGAHFGLWIVANFNFTSYPTSPKSISNAIPGRSTGCFCWLLIIGSKFVVKFHSQVQSQGKKVLVFLSV